MNLIKLIIERQINEKKNYFKADSFACPLEAFGNIPNELFIVILITTYIGQLFTLNNWMKSTSW